MVGIVEEFLFNRINKPRDKKELKSCWISSETVSFPCRKMWNICSSKKEDTHKYSDSPIQQDVVLQTNKRKKNKQNKLWNIKQGSIIKHHDGGVGLDTFIYGKRIKNKLLIFLFAFSAFHFYPFFTKLLLAEAQHDAHWIFIQPFWFRIHCKFIPSEPGIHAGMLNSFV